MGVVIVEGEGTVLGVNLGRPIVTNGVFATRSSQITLRTCSVIWVCLCLKFFVNINHEFLSLKIALGSQCCTFIE